MYKILLVLTCSIFVIGSNPITAMEPEEDPTTKHLRLYEEAIKAEKEGKLTEAVKLAHEALDAMPQGMLSAHKPNLERILKEHEPRLAQGAAAIQGLHNQQDPELPVEIQKHITQHLADLQAKELEERRRAQGSYVTAG